MGTLKQIVTQERLRELLSYDPGTGLFTWIVPHGRHGRLPAGLVAGTVGVDGALVIRLDGRLYRAHQLAWLCVHGCFEREIDHRDNNPANNRLANLRACQHRQNTQNVRRHRDNASGFKGVWSKRGKGRWVAAICVNGKRKHLGCFDTPQEAARAYDDAAVSLHGEYAKPNKVSDDGSL